MPRGQQTHDYAMARAAGASEPLLVDAGKPPANGAVPEVEAGEKPQRSQDGELKAMAAMLRILDKLPDDAARRRVVCYVSDRWHDERDV